MAVKTTNYNFDKQEEIQVASKPQIKLFKKGDKFIWFIKSISDNPLEVWVDNGLWGTSFGNKVFNFVAIWKDSIDHKSSDWTATWEPIENEIIEGEEYSFFTNYTKKDFLNVNGSKLSVMPLWGIIKLENMWKKKSEKSSFSYKDVSIIWMKDAKTWVYIIHPDYKKIDDFKDQEEISIEDIPF